MILVLFESNEKMYALHFAEYSPETLVTREISRAKNGQKVIRKWSLNLWDGNGGRGVLVTAHDDPNFRSMLEILTENEEQYILGTRISARNCRWRQANHFNWLANQLDRCYVFRRKEIIAGICMLVHGLNLVN